MDAGQDWVVRHGRAVALSVVLKVAPDTLLTDEFRPRIMKAIYKCIEADRVSVHIQIFKIMKHEFAHFNVLGDMHISQVPKTYTITAM